MSTLVQQKRIRVCLMRSCTAKIREKCNFRRVIKQKPNNFWSQKLVWANRSWGATCRPCFVEIWRGHAFFVLIWHRPTLLEQYRHPLKKTLSWHSQCNNQKVYEQDTKQLFLYLVNSRFTNTPGYRKQWCSRALFIVVGRAWHSCTNQQTSLC